MPSNMNLIIVDLSKREPLKCPQTVILYLNCLLGSNNQYLHLKLRKFSWHHFEFFLFCNDKGQLKRPQIYKIKRDKTEKKKFRLWNRRQNLSKMKKNVYSISYCCILALLLFINFNFNYCSEFPFSFSFQSLQSLAC